MDLFTAIEKRRTIRSFRQKEVEDEKLYRLIDAARMAPSGGNQQPLRFVVARDSELVERLFHTTRWAALVAPHRTPQTGINAPPVFVAVTAAKGLNPQAEAGAAIQNMLLAAWGIGLGGCWIGAYNHADADAIMGLEENRESLYLVALGYPDEDPVCEEAAGASGIRYYLSDDNVLHVPKLSVEAIAEWR